MYARALSENLYVLCTLFVQFYSIDMNRYEKRPTHFIHKSDQCWMIVILSKNCTLYLESVAENCNNYLRVYEVVNEN